MSNINILSLVTRIVRYQEIVPLIDTKYVLPFSIEELESIFKITLQRLSNSSQLDTVALYHELMLNTFADVILSLCAL